MNWSFTPEERALLDSLRARDPKINFDRVAGLTNPAAIPRLVELITAERKGPTADAIKAIGRLLPLVPRSQFRRLDREVRGHWISWGEGALKPRDVGRLAKRTERPFVTTAMCSMHRSGFVREEAVRRLSLFGDGKELPYLLLRAADWVPEVRGIAIEAVLHRLHAAYAEHFVTNLAIVEGGSFKEGRATELAPRILTFLRQPECRGVLLRGLGDSDLPTRRAVARLSLDSGWDDVDELIERALDQDDVVVATVVVDAAIEHLSDVGLRSLLSRIVRHSLGRVRQAALRTLATRFPDEADVPLRTALFDRQAGVRSTAQWFLSKRGVNVAEEYRAALRGNTRLSLLGLASLAIKEDAERARRHLSHSLPAIRRAAVKALAACDPEGSRSELLTALEDLSPGVSREARNALERRASVVADKVWDTAQATPTSHVVANCYKLLRRLGKWDLLRFGLRSLRSPDTDRTAAGRELVELALLQWNRSFIDPSKPKLAEIESLLGSVRGSLPPEVLSELDFALKMHTAPRPIHDANVRKEE